MHACFSSHYCSLVGVCIGDRATIKAAEEKAVSKKEQSTGPGDEDVTTVVNKPSSRKRKSENGAKEKKIHNKVSIKNIIIDIL